MGLFSRKAKPTTSSEQTLHKELSQMDKDGRLHARVRITEPSFGSLRLASGLAGPVVDLSYSGLAALFPEGSLGFSRSETVSCHIDLLGHGIAASGHLVRMSKAVDGKALAGFSLRHESPATLIFLREFIEPSRCGQSFSLLAPQLRQSRYQSPDWHCYRGDGPVDLLVHTGPDHALHEALLTLRMGESYVELIYKSGELKTGRSLGTASSAADPGVSGMSSTGELDKKILRQAYYTLAASPQACHTLVGPMLATIEHHLKHS